jgi:hypothetical protein
MTSNMHDIDLPPVHDESSGTVYVPWYRDGAIGFRVERGGHPDEYIYLNPSDDTDDGQPNVFVYQGTAGDPNCDGPQHFYMVQEGNE